MAIFFIAGILAKGERKRLSLSPRLCLEQKRHKKSLFIRLNPRKKKLFVPISSSTLLFCTINCRNSKPRHAPSFLVRVSRERTSTRFVILCLRKSEIACVPAKSCFPLARPGQEASTTSRKKTPLFFARLWTRWTNSSRTCMRKRKKNSLLWFKGNCKPEMNSI